jgi:hypothetical protein
MSYARCTGTKTKCSSVHAVSLLGIDDVDHKLNISQSNARNIFQLSLLEKLLRRKFDLPKHILELIRSYIFCTPFVFKSPVFRLISGSRLYRPLSPEEANQSEVDNEDKSSQRKKENYEASKAFDRLTIKEPYRIRRNREFMLGNQQRVLLFRIVEIWKPVRMPKQDRLLDYTSLLGNFLKQHQKYRLVCDPEEEVVLKSHIGNILANLRSYSLDITETSVMELVKRDMIWIANNGFGYLCMSSRTEIQNLFCVECINGEWQFSGEDNQIWSEGVRSTTPCLLRFSTHESYYYRGSTLTRCI